MKENLQKFLDAAEYSKQTIVKSDTSFNENKHSLGGFLQTYSLKLCKKWDSGTDIFLWVLQIYSK